MKGLWPHLERLGGGIGTRGPGEQQIETDRRIARQRITRLRRELDKVGARRRVERGQRRRSLLPTLTLTGYTNAGKSALMNALVSGRGAEGAVTEEAGPRKVASGPRLFQTLDPTTRMFERKGNSYLLVDSVGLIRKLPHNLVPRV